MKKLSAGSWIALITSLFTIASVIVYGVNINSAGYFQNAAVGNLVLYCILAVVMLIASVVLGQIKTEGGAAAAVDLIMGALQIAAPVLLTLCLINLIAARVEGLGFIYFSNADVILEVQTPQNLSSATGTIASMVCLGISMLAGMVCAFCGIRKKNA